MNKKELDLWKHYEATKDIDTRNKLIEMHMKIAEDVANYMSSKKLKTYDKDTIYSVALEGLIDAVRLFRLKFNVTFKTYAVYRIKGAVIDNVIRKSAEGRILTYEKILSYMKSENLADFPSHDEVKRILGREVRLQTYFLCYNKYHSLLEISGDVKLGKYKDQRRDIYDFNKIYSRISGPYETAFKQEFLSKIKECVAKLPKKEKTLLLLYYFEGLSLNDIGLVFGGVSESRVSQLHTKALKKLRSNRYIQNVGEALFKE